MNEHHLILSLMNAGIPADPFSAFLFAVQLRMELVWGGEGRGDGLGKAGRATDGGLSSKLFTGKRRAAYKEYGLCKLQEKQ